MTRKQDEEVSILNTVPVFISKTYSMVSVPVFRFRILRTLKLLAGAKLEQVLSSETKSYWLKKCSQSILNTATTALLSGNSICMGSRRCLLVKMSITSSTIVSRKIPCKKILTFIESCWKISHEKTIDWANKRPNIYLPHKTGYQMRKK